MTTKKKATAGQKIMGVPEEGSALYNDMPQEERESLVTKATRIDAAIKRAVKEAFWEGYGFCADKVYGAADRKAKADQNRKAIESKYGVKL